MRNSNQRGIVIGPILYIVAILAVLAAAIAAGSGGFNGDISAVKAKAQATAILGYVNELQIGVDRVMSRCPDTEISLANSVDSGYAENPLAPSDKSCHVFNVNGGGVLFKEPPPDVDLTGVPPEIRHYFINMQMEVIGLGKTALMNGVPAGANLGADLAIILPGLNRDLCLKINDMVGVTTESGDVPIIYNIIASKDYDYNGPDISGWWNPCGAGVNYGKRSCCGKLNLPNNHDSRINNYAYFHVLHVR